MTQLTLGQRIAARRKLLNLSQETLAEQLEVSRQAVSKWESDGAIPEIDKLITLGKIFDVSVGWLLGVEAEPTSQLCELNEQQIKIVEQIVSRYNTPKKIPRWKIAVISILVLVGLFGIFEYYRDQVDDLKSDNTSTREQIEILSENNQNLQSQIQELNKMLTQQAEESLLLSDILLDSYISDDLQKITTVLYLFPKVFQESNTAYISIENPSIGYNEMVECIWDRDHYTFRHTFPAVDGYQIHFLLVNDYGYETEDLVMRDPGFARLGTYCTFHIDPSHSQFSKMQRKESTLLLADESVYSFNAPIHTPHIFAKTAVAYSDVRITLTLKGSVIWERSYTEDFKKATGGISINAGENAVMSEIEVSLPQLNEGDKLELVLSAETVNGGAATQKYTTLLDMVEVVQDTDS